MSLRTPTLRPIAVLCIALAATLLATARPVPGQEFTDAELVAALRQGGYTIYFRHAATDWRRNDRVSAAGDWTSCDPGKMRQLSEEGRAMALRIGAAMRALEIPVAKVLSSEYCRAAETARLLGLGPVETTRDIMNMRAAEYVGGRAAVVRRARRVLSAPPPPGQNVVVVGHGNLMRAATGAYAGEAGSGVYAPRPDRETGVELVAELAAEDWQQLASRFAAR